MKRRSFLVSGAMPMAAASAAAPTKPSWPVFDDEEEKALLAVLRSGRWNRGSAVEQFEREYAKLLGSSGCLATANGTSALLTALHALGIGRGQEVIVPPYTFVATINVVLAVGATPVFVDTDPKTFQIDASKIEGLITDRTAAIMPVHLGGNVADMDAIGAIAKKRNLPVIEDACQAHMAEWRGRRVGSIGVCGAFSFQASKNLNSGEGGALASSDPAFLDRAFAFHNNGRGRRGGAGFDYTSQGLNLRLTEFQAALLLAQMKRLADQTKVREQNAAYLTSMLKEIPGVHPAAQYDGCTRNAYHLYMFRSNSRDGVLKALNGAGLPGSRGYSPLNQQPFITASLNKHLAAKELSAWVDRNRCPENDRLCEQAVWFPQTFLLGPRSEMERVAVTVRKASR